MKKKVNQRPNQRSFLVLTGFLAITLAAVVMAPASAQDARVRVVHASPDAPNVDVCADGGVLFADAPFPAATSYVTVPAATYAVKVVGAGAGCESAGVIEADLPLAAGTDTTVVAVNLLASIEPLVLADDNTRPAPGNVRIRFVHASPDAPAVDIAVAGSAPDEPLFNDIPFKGVGGYIEVPGGTYDLEVRDETGNTVVLPLNGVALEAGAVYTVFAVGLLAGPPDLAPLLVMDAEPEARVRVVHASPDAPDVDVCADGAELFTGAPFTGITDYASVPPATYAVKVVGAGAGCGSAGVIEADLPLGDGTDTTVVAVNYLASIEPLVLADDNTPPAEGNAKVRFVHASPDAPAVDIAVAGSAPDAPLFDDIPFKGVGDYLEVPAGIYDLEVRDATGATVVLPLGNVPLDPGAIYTVFAMGLLSGTPALGPVIALDLPGTGSARHSADQDGDAQISLSEVLRVVQLYNLGYQCGVGTEDGYAPLPGETNCEPHALDYNPPDFVISLEEVLRLVQFYNSDGYVPCPEGEDGYCVVAT